MTLDYLNEEIKQNKHSHRHLSGSREKCYQEAQRLGYELREETEARILMQYREKNYWATITETGDSQRPWELVVYRYKPTEKESHPLESFFKRREDDLRKRP